MILLLNRSHTESVDNAIFIIAMQPLIWGDTFGEVIGSFYGKREFYVRGIGEVNKKTVEGTIGCFVSSFVSLVVTYGIYGSEIPFILPTVIVLLYTSLIATFVEVASFRGTDNFFLQTVVLLVLLWSADIK